MTRFHRFPSAGFVPSLCAGLLFGLSLYNADALAAGDAEAGAVKSEACQGCHGLDGNSFSPEWPSLAGQHQGYLIAQVKNFQSGARQNELMSPMVEGLAEQDILDITAYFAGQSLRIEEPSQSAAGEKLYRGGNAYNHIPACAGCHGPNGAGNSPGDIPRLAGQKVDYTAQTLRDFKNGVRGNDRNSIMTTIAGRLSENEITALAQFLAGLGATTTADASAQ